VVAIHHRRLLENARKLKKPARNREFKGLLSECDLDLKENWMYTLSGSTIKKFPPFMKTGSSLLCSQDPNTGSYPEPHEFNSQPHINYLRLTLHRLQYLISCIYPLGFSFKILYEFLNFLCVLLARYMSVRPQVFPHICPSNYPTNCMSGFTLTSPYTCQSNPSSTSPCTCPSVLLNFHLRVLLSARLPVPLHIHLLFYLSVYLSVYFFVYLSFYLSLYLSLCLSTSQSACPRGCPFICTSTSPYTCLSALRLPVSLSIPLS
jgi:hypothetical protein